MLNKWLTCFLASWYVLKAKMLFFLFVCLFVCLVGPVTLQLKECKTGAPNDGFLLNTLKTPFRLSRALLDI